MFEFFSNKVSSFWNTMPNIDGQTLISIIIGAVLTLATFWLAYKKTIGAQDERTRSTNLELVALTTRRVAVERERILAAQFNEFRKAKAYRNSTRASRLLSFDDVRAIVLTDVIENPFLDKPAKAEIVGLLKPVENEGPPASGSDEGANSERIGAVVAVATVSISVGAFGSLISSAPFIKDTLEKAAARLSSQQESVLSLLAATTSLAAISIMAFFFIRTRMAAQREMERIKAAEFMILQSEMRRRKTKD